MASIKEDNRNSLASWLKDNDVALLSAVTIAELDKLKAAGDTIPMKWNDELRGSMEELINALTVIASYAA